jgi:hypothetical protein
LYWRYCDRVDIAVVAAAGDDVRGEEIGRRVMTIPTLSPPLPPAPSNRALPQGMAGINWLLAATIVAVGGVIMSRTLAALAPADARIASFKDLTDRWGASSSSSVIVIMIIGMVISGTSSSTVSIIVITTVSSILISICPGRWLAWRQPTQGLLPSRT